MARVYTGFSTFEFQKNKTFQLHDIEIVKMDLLNHIYTRRGERVGLPRFGTLIPTLAFEPLTEELVELVYEELETVFEYDPRVRIIELTVIPSFDNNLLYASAVLDFIELNLRDSLELNIEFDQ